MSPRTLIHRLDPRTVRATVPLCVVWMVSCAAMVASQVAWGPDWTIAPWSLLTAWWLVSLAYTARDSRRAAR